MLHHMLCETDVAFQSREVRGLVGAHAAACSGHDISFATNRTSYRNDGKEEGGKFSKGCRHSLMCSSRIVAA